MANPYVPSIRGDDAIQTYQLQSALLRQRQPSRQAQMAQALMQQGTSTAPVQHWTQGLARALQGVVGGYMAQDSEREDKASEQEMLARMIGERDQTKQSETAQLAQAGVPGFQMPMQQPTPGVAREMPLAPAGGGDVVMPAGGTPEAPPQPPSRPVNADLIAALSGMAGQGNKIAAGALPGFQFQYQDAEAKAREARQEAAAAAREARANRDRFGAPVEVMGPNGPMLVRFSDNGKMVPVEGARPMPAPTGAGPFDGKAIEGQALNIVLAPDADPTSSVYAASYQRLYGPRQIQQADGTVVTITPQPPEGVRPPSRAQAGAAPQAPAAPPAAGAPAALPVTTTEVPGATITRTGAGKDAPLTEAQSKANMFGNAMTEGNRIIAEIGTPSASTIAAWRNLPEGAVNLALPEKDQRYFNALRQFAAGVLRKETGAAFTPSELLDVQSRFFPMPGDTENTKTQKTRAREQAIESMKVEIPGGFRGQLPPPPQVPGLAGAQPPPAPTKVRTPDEARKLPKGTRIELPDGTMGVVP